MSENIEAWQGIHSAVYLLDNFRERTEQDIKRVAEFTGLPEGVVSEALKNIFECDHGLTLYQVYLVTDNIYDEDGVVEEFGESAPLENEIYFSKSQAEMRAKQLGCDAGDLMHQGYAHKVVELKGKHLKRSERSRRKRGKQRVPTTCLDCGAKLEAKVQEIECSRFQKSNVFIEAEVLACDACGHYTTSPEQTAAILTKIKEIE